MNILTLVFGFLLGIPVLFIVLAIREAIRVGRERYAYDLKQEIRKETLEIIREMLKNRKD